MTKTRHALRLSVLPIAMGVASFSGGASAIDFSLGEVRGQLDSQLAVGLSVSTTSADNRFIHVDTVRNGKDMGGEAAGRTSDDNRLNYDKGDIFFQSFAWQPRPGTLLQ